ncbi:MAG: serine/threonine-protein kinase [Candidatus Eremiobacteraeota bacterium]|nr:serine/threonine-protein kinase [Candidatus Eremiobacteraeota bacterium]
MGSQQGVKDLMEKSEDLYFFAEDSRSSAAIIVVNMGEERPVNRENLAKAISWLSDKETAVLGIDVLLFKEPDADKEVAAALKSMKHVVIPDGAAFKNKWPSLEGVTEASALFPPEGDFPAGTIIRKDYLVRKEEGGRSCSFALALALQAKGIALDQVRLRTDNLQAGSGISIPIEWNRQEEAPLMRINYYRHGFPEIAWQELPGKPRELFRGAVVLIGSHQPQDLFATPLGPRTPGVHIHAHAVNTILTGRFVRRLHWAGDLLIMAVFCLVPALIAVFTRKPMVMVLSFLLLPVLYTLAALELFTRTGIQLRLFDPFAPSGLSFILAIAYRTFSRESEKDAGPAARSAAGAQAGPSEDLIITVSREIESVPLAAGETRRMPKDESAPVQQGYVLVPDFKKDAVIGKYRVLECLGTGGMGQVFLVDHLGLNVKRVIKVIRPDLLANPSVRERFHQEAEAAARLSHPSIIIIHDFGEISGVPYIEMEYFESHSLRYELKSHTPFPPERLVNLLDQIAGGLTCAHNAEPRPMIHRDLKPENILLSEKEHDKLKIIDFGLVKVLQEGVDKSASSSSPIGTPYYMAPEQIKMEHVGPGTDIYSLGIMLFEMATGKRPFDAGSCLEVLSEQLTKAIPSVHALNPSYPPEFDDVLEKAAEKDISRRFASVREFLDEVKKALSHY